MWHLRSQVETGQILLSWRAAMGILVTPHFAVGGGGGARLEILR